MKIGRKITELRKQKKWSQTDLANKVNVSRVIIGRYERDEATPSIDIAKKIADAFGISLDNLVGEGINTHFDKKTVQRINELISLAPEKKSVLFDLIDTYIRDAKTRVAYGS